MINAVLTLLRRWFATPASPASALVAAVAALKPQRLVSLDEHDRARAARYDGATGRATERCLNGIACPGCGAELYDSEPHVVLPAIPPKKRVVCHQCRFAGVRVA